MYKGASKQSQNLKNYSTPGPLPLVLKFLDPPVQNPLNISISLTEGKCEFRLNANINAVNHYMLKTSISLIL